MKLKLSQVSVAKNKELLKDTCHSSLLMKPIHAGNLSVTHSSGCNSPKAAIQTKQVQHSPISLECPLTPREVKCSPYSHHRAAHAHQHRKQQL